MPEGMKTLQTAFWFDDMLIKRGCTCRCRYQSNGVHSGDHNGHTGGRNHDQDVTDNAGDGL
jgi:hypothetical protein